jgi:hypothetical protein
MATDIFPYTLAPYHAALQAGAKPSLLGQFCNLISEICAHRGQNPANVRGDAS